MAPQLDPCRLLYLAYTIVLLSFGYLFAVTFLPIPPTGEDNAKYIVGFLVGTGLATIIVFYFRRPGTPEPRTLDDGPEPLGALTMRTMDSTTAMHTETKTDEPPKVTEELQDAKEKNNPAK